MFMSRSIGFLILYVVSQASGFYFGRNISTYTCTPFKTKGLEWILEVRQPNYGWEEHTHRALIALAINRVIPEEEAKQMALRLDVHITKALLRSSSSMDTSNELALYIHALVATNRNPRNFYGFDLVAELLRRVKTMESNVHPFLVLALCNSKAIELEHLHVINKYLSHNDTESKRADELKSIALKAFACAASLDIGTDVFRKEMEDAADCLKMKQGPDGSFYNVYVTALAVQALVACRSSTKWRKEQALKYLQKHSGDINMVSTYLTELALNADTIPFIKDLHPGLSLVPAPRPTSTYYVQYSLQIGESPEIYFTSNVRVPANSDFFTIMNLCAKESAKFKFSHYIDEAENPVIYEVSGIPNDAEENLFWRLCRQRKLNHTFALEEHSYSPSLLVPEKAEHLIYWYRSSPCR